MEERERVDLLPAEPDEDTLRRVLAEPRKLRDRRLSDEAPPAGTAVVVEKRRQQRHLALVG